MSDLHVRNADWQRDHEALRRIREAVFVIEQSVPHELEWDGEDGDALHFLACEANYPIGTARLLASGQIGRLAVLKDWRGLGMGQALLRAVIRQAQARGLQQLTLSAQVQAAPFYEKLGFRVISEEYLEAGIVHVDMLCSNLNEHSPTTPPGA
jgi:predicted GNAT family N-acyltransferase